MKIQRFTGGILESNGYVIYQNEGQTSYIIDPGYNPKVFMDYIKKNELKLSGILLTHHHYDHTGAVERIQKEFVLHKTVTQHDTLFRIARN